MNRGGKEDRRNVHTTFYKVTVVCLVYIFLILLNPIVHAETYYADLEIDVDSSGFVTIQGTTNHPDLLTENTERYISKKQSYWLLNITKEEVFSDFVFELSLPEGSSINYVKTSGFFNIAPDQDALLIKGFGENKPFSFIVQYQTEKILEEEVTYESYWILMLLVLMIILILVIFFLVRRQRDFDTEPEIHESSEEYSFKGLNARQKEIMKLLINKKIPLTQTDIQKELNLPKAAVSRNVRGLELKGLIEKEKIGMSNLIRLKKP